MYLVSLFPDYICILWSRQVGVGKQLIVYQTIRSDTHRAFAHRTFRFGFQPLLQAVTVCVHTTLAREQITQIQHLLAIARNGSTYVFIVLIKITNHTTISVTVRCGTLQTKQTLSWGTVCNCYPRVVVVYVVVVSWCITRTAFAGPGVGAVFLPGYQCSCLRVGP